MTTKTKSLTSGKVDRRGTNPRSLANLDMAPRFKPGESGNKGNPYPISRQLKDLLRDCKTSKQVAQKLIDTASDPDNGHYIGAIRELLDRTEGKVPGDGVQVNFNEIRIVVVREPLKAKDMPAIEGT